jgi:Holliday junction DNA helicase RuvA
LILEVNQIGYEIQIPARFAKQLTLKAEIIQIFTHLQLREDSTTLFGFASPPERDLFRQFISVTGIGAQLAIALIDTLGSEELVSAIVTGNTRLLCQAPGVGKKTAERLSLELKTKLSQWYGISTISLPAGSALPSQAIVEDLEPRLQALEAPEELSPAGHGRCLLAELHLDDAAHADLLLEETDLHV